MENGQNNATKYMFLAMLWTAMIAGGIALIVYAPNWVISITGIAMAYYAWRKAVGYMEKAQN